MIEDTNSPIDYSMEVQLALLHRADELHAKNIEALNTKVNNLEKSDAVTKEQINMVFSSIGEIKDIQKTIVSKLDKKQEDDLKESKEMKMLLIGSALTSIASLVVALLVK